MCTCFFKFIKGSVYVFKWANITVQLTITQSFRGPPTKIKGFFKSSNFRNKVILSFFEGFDGFNPKTDLFKGLKGFKGFDGFLERLYNCKEKLLHLLSVQRE